MSFREAERAREEEHNRLGNMWNSTVALIRERFLRFLGLFADHDKKKKEKLTEEIFLLVSFLKRRKRYGQRLQTMILDGWPKFKPEIHFGKIERDNHGRVKKFTRADSSLCPDELTYVRHMWSMCFLHEDVCDTWIETLELYADGLFTMTGTAIVKEMEDFTKGRTNYAMDYESADQAAAAMWDTESSAA